MLYNVIYDLSFFVPANYNFDKKHDLGITVTPPDTFNSYYAVGKGWKIPTFHEITSNKSSTKTLRDFLLEICPCARYKKPKQPDSIKKDDREDKRIELYTDTYHSGDVKFHTLSSVCEFTEFETKWINNFKEIRTIRMENEEGENELPEVYPAKYLLTSDLDKA